MCRTHSARKSWLVVSFLFGIFQPVCSIGNDSNGKNASLIDGYVMMAAERDGVSLPPIVNDDLFLRRISLDLLGRIPTRQELTEFRSNPDRAAAVDRMLATVEHAEAWSRLWTSTLIGYGNQAQSDHESLRSWLQSQFYQQAPFDDIVYQLIAAEGRSAFDGPTNFMLHHARDPVVPVGRIFLGVQLDCARCHDHPTDRWNQSDFEGMQRFFIAMRPRQTSPGNYELVDTSATGAPPKFLTGSKPRTQRWRQELALMVTTSKPFGRATANRLWYHFFGRGVANPPDTVNGDEKPKDIVLVEKLTKQLRSDGYQWNDLIRQICLSRAYQREISSQDFDWPLLPTAKPLTPDQLFVSLHVAMQEPIADQRRTQFLRVISGGSLDQPFHNTWESKESAQAMMSRMNMALPNREIPVQVMFEQVLSRPPTPQQTQLCKDQPTQAVLFALLNSNEFYFWH